MTKCNSKTLRTSLGNGNQIEQSYLLKTGLWINHSTHKEGDQQKEIKNEEINV